jgi:hypothetical protein
VLACHRCGGRLCLIALIEEAAAIERILRHLGVPTAIPSAVCHPRHFALDKGSARVIIGAYNVLKNAPLTGEEVTADEWTHPYSREQAAYPLPFVCANKFWPAVARVDNPYGDRNLICACPPPDAYAEQLASSAARPTSEE